MTLRNPKNSQSTHQQPTRTRSTSPLQKRIAIGLLAAFTYGTMNNCAIGPEFRGAAVGNLQVGVNAILDGLVDGTFAVLTPEPTNTE